MQVFDLTHTISDGLKTHDSHPRAVINDFVSHDFTAPRYLPPCKGFATKQLMISDHLATHVDAPTHFHADGKHMAQQPPEMFMGKAVLLDVSGKELNRRVDLALVKETLARDGLEIKHGDMVLIRAWDGPWGSHEFHQAGGLALDAAKWLVEKGIKAVGIDLGNIETNSDMTRQVHVFLLGEEIPIYENLANLGGLPQKRFMFYGLPLKLEGATGSPVRAVAVLDD